MTKEKFDAIWKQCNEPHAIKISPYKVILYDCCVEIARLRGWVLDEKTGWPVGLEGRQEWVKKS